MAFFGEIVLGGFVEDFAPFSLLLFHVYFVMSVLYEYDFHLLFQNKEVINKTHQKINGVSCTIENIFWALAGVTPWIERRPVNQRVTGSIPSQGTCLGCWPGPSRGRARGNHTLMFLSLSFSLPSLLF